MESSISALHSSWRHCNFSGVSWRYCFKTDIYSLRQGLQKEWVHWRVVSWFWGEFLRQTKQLAVFYIIIIRIRIGRFIPSQPSSIDRSRCWSRFQRAAQPTLGQGLETIAKCDSHSTLSRASLLALSLDRAQTRLLIGFRLPLRTFPQMTFKYYRLDYYAAIISQIIGKIIPPLAFSCAVSSSLSRYLLLLSFWAPHPASLPPKSKPPQGWAQKQHSKVSLIEHVLPCSCGW